MSVAKIVMLVIYAVLIGLAATQGDSALAVWSLRILVVLAVVHAIETMAFFKLCKEAGGSLVGHLLSVFVYGQIHVIEIKKAAANS
ncbi:MAG: hypothetical protein ACI9JM_000982 [Halioglobus sp.]|jgi:uncharacterized protein YhhL (DUF1145 family)